MFGLKWLVDHGVLPKDRLEEYYASYVAGIFRTVRFGTGEAHGRAEMMEFNYLSERGAIAQAGGRYRIDYAKIPPAHRARWRKNCSSRKRRAIARAPKRGSRNTTRCRPT